MPVRHFPMEIMKNSKSWALEREKGGKLDGGAKGAIKTARRKKGRGGVCPPPSYGGWALGLRPWKWPRIAQGSKMAWSGVMGMKIEATNPLRVFSLRTVCPLKIASSFLPTSPLGWSYTPMLTWGSRNQQLLGKLENFSREDLNRNS